MVVATSAVLAACATPTAAPAPGGNAPAAGTNPVDNVTLSKDKPTEVVFSHRYSGDQVTALTEIVKAFNDSNQYGVTVKLEGISGGYPDLYNKINASIQGGKPPAMAQAYQNQAAFYRNDGAVIDLNPYITSKKYGLTDDDKKDFYEIFLNTDKNPQYPGEVLGWPTSRSLDMMYTNLKILGELGVQDPPKSMKDFEALSCKAKEKGYKGFVWRGDASDFAGFVFANGGAILKADASAYDFNSAAGVESLAMLQRMFKAGCAEFIKGSNDWQAPFADGKILFTAGSSTGLPFVIDAVEKAAKNPFALAPYPQANPDKPIYNVYGASWSVFKTSPEQQLGAWLFIKYFSEKDNLVKWGKASNYMVLRKSATQPAIDAVLSAPRYKAYPKAADGYGSLYKLAPNSAVESPVAGYDPVRELIQNTIEAVAVKGQGDPKAELDKAVKTANEELAKNAPKKK